MIEKKYCVYKHTNKANGKSYIGMCGEQSTINRWANGKGYRYNKQFAEEIDFYGWDGFTHEIIKSGMKKDEAYEKEKEYIKLYQSDKPDYGYNISHGGNASFKGLHHTEDSKKRISQKMKQYEFTEQHKKHISEMKQGKLHHMARKVYQFALDGSFIREWDFLSQPCTMLNIQKTNICRCCRGKSKTAGGYIWRYERG